MGMRVLSVEWIIPVLAGGCLLFWHDGWVSPSSLIYTVLLGVFLGFMPRGLLPRVIYTLGFPLLPFGMILALFASVHLSAGALSDPEPAFRDGSVSLAAAVALYALHFVFFGAAALAYVSILLVKRRLSLTRMA